MIRVAIDGPAGVGKSSTSKALAKYYGFAYLDTGAMYRACAWWCMHKGIDLDAETIDEQLVTETVGEFFTDGHFDISVDPDDPKVYADDEDISEAIRSSEVSSHVSKVSNIIPVRHVLIAAQRAYIAREASVDSFSEGAGIVAEGRDITTVVAPDAEVRILLTAREEVRQARRSGQAVSGVGGENVAARDKADSKVTNFTSAAEGVLTVDNSDLNFGETLDVLVRIVDDAIEEQEYRQYVSNLEGYELDEGDEELIDGTAFSGGESKNGPKPVGVLAVVGRPNVGKSTILSVVTSAKPKIGNYHFTTLTPNLGIVRRHGKDIVLADIPGLIEGAADGAGLGHDFLRHVERTRLLLHVLDIAGSEGRDPVEDFDQINHELANYGELAERPQIVVCNKSDLPDSEENVARLKAHLAELGLDYPVFVVSAATHQGFDALLDKTGDMLEALPPIVHFEEEVSYDDSVKPGTFEVVRDGAVFEVVGSSMQRLIDSVNFDDEESMSWFHRTLRKWGVIDALRKAGAQEGDTVRIIDMEFDFVE